MNITQPMVTLNEASYRVVGKREGSDLLYHVCSDFTTLSGALKYIQKLRTNVSTNKDTYAIVEMKPILMEL